MVASGEPCRARRITCFSFERRTSFFCGWRLVPHGAAFGLGGADQIGAR